MHRCGVIAVLLIACALLVELGSTAPTRRSRRNRVVTIHEHNSAVKKVNLKNFREVVLDPTVPVFFVMYDGSDEKATSVLEAAVDTVTKELEGLAEFAYLDGSSEEGKEVTQMFSVQRFPAMVLFNPELAPIANGQEGHFMKQTVSYEGDGTAHSMIRFFLQYTSTFHLERLADDHDLAHFFAKFPNADMPRFIYFTSQNHTSPLYIAASQYYRYGGVFGVAFANQSAEIMQRYKIDPQTLPALVALLPSTGGDEVIRFVGMTAQTTLDELKAFCGTHALNFERQAAIRPYIYGEEEKIRQKEKEHAKIINALPPKVIVSKKEWVNECLTRKKGYCLCVFVDGISDESRLPLGMLLNVSHKIATKSSAVTQIVVVDGTENYEIVNHFGIANGLPDVVVLNPVNNKKRTYFNLVGSVTERGITNFFLDRVVKGTGSKPYKAKAVPKFRKPSTQSSGDDDEISDEL